MNWDALRFFLALTREGSVSGAGRVLSVKHTTVARRISALEEQLGSRLFDRTPEGYILTQVGENLFPHALAIETEMQSAEREVFGMDAELKGPLTLTASSDVMTNLILPQLPWFKKDYPGLTLNLLGVSHLADLAAREADIAVRMTPKPPEYLIGRQVLPMRHGVYATKEYLNQIKKSGERHKLILWSGDVTPEWAREHFPGAEVVLRTNDIHSMAVAVRNGLGLARMPCYVGDSDKSIGRLDLRLTPSAWGVWVLSHIDLRSTARIRVCRDFLIEAINSKKELILGEQSNYL